MDGASAPWPSSDEARRKVASRWASFGPYYAMFPLTFARGVISSYTAEGDAVLDPFAGRGTSIFCAQEVNRQGLGVEINALGWIFGSTKLAPAPVEEVLDRLRRLARDASYFQAEAHSLPQFFHFCFAPRVCAFLVAARSSLNWRTCHIDRTVMAFILIYLHGKIEGGQPRALSNQMRQTKAMAPGYSIAWWIKNGLCSPPEVDPLQFLSDRVAWRYKYGAPNSIQGTIHLGDCRTVLTNRSRQNLSGFKLLLTSPPYRGVTSYYYDQWLRFWLLGETDHPKRDGLSWKKKFDSEFEYQKLLMEAFRACEPLLLNKAVVYVRSDARPATLNIVRSVLETVFPHKHMSHIEAPLARPTQTSLFGDHGRKPGEVDLVMTP